MRWQTAVPLPHLAEGPCAPAQPSGQRSIFRFGVERTVWDLCITGSSPEQPRVITASHFPQRLIILIITFLLPSSPFYPCSPPQQPSSLPSSSPCPCQITLAVVLLPSFPPALSSEPRGAGTSAPECSTGLHRKREMIPCGFPGGPVALF